MSNEPKLPFEVTTSIHPSELPLTIDGVFTQLGQPVSELSKSQSVPPEAIGIPEIVEKSQTEDSIPGYQILDRLGRGGMGIVHLARDLHADRLVALKQVASDSIRENVLSRFRTEAQAIARLKHPQIIQIFHVGEQEGRPYFTMEYCPGGDLGEFLNREPQTPLLAASIAEKIALAIHHAHENGIIHRDLKPGNILIASRLLKPGNSTDSGSAPSKTPSNMIRVPFTPELLRITDFGLAKNLESDSHVTQTQNVLGTPGYMAPEQATSTKHVGPPADIWAIGVILYEMITGSLPFVGADILQLIDNLRSKDPIPPSEKVKVPKDLETICLKCLRKDPLDRYASAQALAEDLRAFQEGRSISARRMSRTEKGIRWIRKNPVLAGLTSLTAISLILGTIISLFYASAEKRKSEELTKSQDELKVAVQQAQAAEERERNRAEELKQSRDDLQIAIGKTQEAEKSERKRAEELKQSRDDLKLALEDAKHQNANANFLLASSAKAPGLGQEFLSRIPPEHRKWEWYYLKRQLQGGLFPLLGHTSSVRGVSWSPDGSRIVSASYDKTLRIWDAKTGQSISELKGHPFEVSSASWSPDGSRIVSGNRNGTLRIWDANTGQSLNELKGHSNWVWSVSWSPDGSRIVSGSDDQTLRIWDAKTGKSLRELRGHTLPVKSASWSPDRSRIVSASSDSTLRIWDAQTGQSLHELKGHSFIVSSVGWSPDGSQIVSGSHDKTVRIWDSSTGQSLRELKGHTDWVFSVHWSPDGSRIVSGSKDGTVRIWDAKTGQSLRELKGHTLEVSSVRWSPDGSRIVSASDDQTLRIWDIKSEPSLPELHGHTKEVSSIDWSPDGSKMVSGSDDKTLRIWDSKTGLFLTELKGHSTEVRSVSWSPDGSRIVSGSRDGIVRIWDAITGQSLKELQGHRFEVSSLSWSPDSSRIVSGCFDRTLRIWDAKTGEFLIQLRGEDTPIDCSSWSPDGSRIVSGNRYANLYIWDPKTGQIINELKGHGGWVWCVSWSPDSRRIVSGSVDSTIRIWDAQTGQSLAVLQGHTSDVRSVSWSPDGSRIVSGSKDGTLRIWDVKTGQSLALLQGYPSWVVNIRWSPDGTRILCGSNDGKVRIWNAKPIVDEKISEEETLRRKWLMRLDPDWYQEQLQNAEKEKNSLGVNHHRYWYHQAKAKDAFLYSRFDEAFAHQVVAAALKPKQPEPVDLSDKSKK